MFILLFAITFSRIHYLMLFQDVNERLQFDLCKIPFAYCCLLSNQIYTYIFIWQYFNF